MIKKDYLLRLFQLLIDSMNKIWNNIENGETELAKIQISETYELYGNNAIFFLKTDIDKIIFFFSDINVEYLQKIQLLSQVIYYDSLLKEEEIAKEYLKRAIELAKYYAANTNDFSFEVNNLLLEMKSRLASFGW